MYANEIPIELTPEENCEVEYKICLENCDSNQNIDAGDISLCFEKCDNESIKCFEKIDSKEQ
jgi:hypothetical protein